MLAVTATSSVTGTLKVSASGKAARGRRSATMAQRRGGVVVRAEGDDTAAACTGSCDSCGLAKDKMQCDGSGRIQGGLAAIELFSWWPLKAYRPCPGLIESGGVYTRKGQDVNTIWFGDSGKE